MYPYLAMLAVPSGLALMSPSARRVGLLLVALLYFLLVAFRFHVGMDWNNYLYIYESKRTASLADMIFAREPGYGFLMWMARQTGWGMIFINAISGLAFCWGFFAVARQTREPWIAVAIASPLLVVAFAMSATRQALAAGIIFSLMAHWEQRGTLARMLLVLLASLFHFSSIFVMIFVALAARAPGVVRIGGAMLVAGFVAALVRWAPDSVEAYSRLYVGIEGKLSAPGAIFQVAPLAAAALIYFAYRQAWLRVNGEIPLYANMAWAALLIVPLIPLSSVGAYRFALYFWPMAMTVYAGVPAIIESGIGRLLYRLCIVIASFALLIGWLQLANNSYAWLPYRSWLLQPAGARLTSGAPIR